MTEHVEALRGLIRKAHIGLMTGESEAWKAEKTAEIAALSAAIEALERVVQLEAYAEAHGRVLTFLNAYALGEALTFVDPRNGDLVSADEAAQALAIACLAGPAAGDGGRPKLLDQADSAAQLQSRVAALEGALKLIEGFDGRGLLCPSDFYPSDNDHGYLHASGAAFSECACIARATLTEQEPTDQ